MTTAAPLPQVRIALPSDTDEIMALCHALHQENGLFTFSEERIRNHLQRCWNKQGTIVGVIGPSGKIEATSCLVISDFYYSDDWHLAELWNYVAEPYRRSRNAEALIEFCKRCADEIGIPLITGIITNKKLAEKIRLYRKRLGPPAGAFFIHGARWISDVMPTPDDFWRSFEPKVAPEMIEAGLNALRERQLDLPAEIEQRKIVVGIFKAMSRGNGKHA